MKFLTNYFKKGQLSKLFFLFAVRRQRGMLAEEGSLLLLLLWSAAMHLTPVRLASTHPIPLPPTPTGPALQGGQLPAAHHPAHAAGRVCLPAAPRWHAVHYYRCGGPGQLAGRFMLPSNLSIVGWRRGWVLPGAQWRWWQRLGVMCTPEWPRVHRRTSLADTCSPCPGFSDL